MRKRAFDVCVAIAATALFAPLFLLLWCMVRIRLGPPVLFRQVRPGMRGRPFVIFKFRTMTDERDEQGRLRPDHARLSPFGQWLRRTSLDELPELINVVRGEMSLVGPRPLLMEYLPLYTAQQARRHEIRPGITGWAQVNGRNALSWEDKFKLDLWYVENHSFMLDLRILWLTVKRVLRAQDVSQAGEATAQRFTGSSP